ncbi:ISH8-type transposase ISHvo13 (plasmid) [Haloferax volcanii DS2]|uniref:ISH8-type transposase ISHvo13 n=2 Tax=Haloferax volcanii (strain ATCC 29605 / DSM 3757 / JCM 8879 / NBRC 14742 / NCIMB 2012 / VKM B-1768 / DS2) TaxID=309800 RepID=D4GQE8_HALVD|nr:IS4-like element ISHvo13 family transposase [Haloferax volcanii]ADE02119.1 ISH8-type transposase ISHvo13 [Haloferax volcanii DS2]
MLKELSPDLIRRRLTSLFPGELIEDIARERDVVQRHRRIDVTALVWTLILGFAVGGESRTIAGFQRAYAAATNQTLSRSSFYDRFTPALGQLLSDLLEHALEEVAVPHTLAPQLQQFRDVMIADATVFRLHRLLSEFPATHPDQSGAKLHLVHNLTKQTIERFELTDERSHESSQFRTGNWLRGRLLLFDLGFYSYRRFALIEENGGFFLSRLKTNANPRITEARRKWRGRAISLPDRRLQDVLGGLTREIIDVTAEVSFKRRPYGEKHSSATIEFRVVGVRNEDTDDYHLYITNLPDEFTPEQVAALYGVRWEVEVLFRELKSMYGLEKFQTSNPAIVELLVVAALLTLTVSRALLGVFQRMHPETMFPRERWAKTFRSFAQLILEDLAQSFGHPPPNLAELMFCNARQPEKSRLLLSERVAEAFRTEVRA